MERDRWTCSAYCGIFALAVVAGWFATSPWPTSSVRTVTCALGVPLILMVQLLSENPLRRRLLIAALVAWCGGSLGWTVARPLAELPSGRGVRVWSVFHYYLGAKYFPELGYTDLYRQALAADADGEHRWSHVRRIRNLVTYEIEDAGEPRRSPLWSDERWRELKSDIAILQPRVPEQTWRDIFRDRGYNATPSFTALRRLLLYDLSPASLAATASFDVIGLIIAFIVGSRVFGVLRALVCATWIALYFGNANDRLIGHPFLYDYLIAMVLAACALRKERPVLGGILLGYAAMVRIFPGLMVLAAVAWWHTLHRRDIRAGCVCPPTGGRCRTVPRLSTAFAVTCAVLVVVGLGNGRGFDGWLDFTSKISRHAESHRLGTRRLGLAHLFTVDWSHLPAADQQRSERAQAWQAQKGVWLVAAGGLGGLWLWATARSRLGLSDMIFASLILVFATLVLSRYYWSSACLFVLIGGSPRDGPMGGRWPAATAAALFAWLTAVYGFWTFDQEALHHYLLANLLAALLSVGGLSLLLLRGNLSATRRILAGRRWCVRAM